MWRNNQKQTGFPPYPLQECDAGGLCVYTDMETNTDTQAEKHIQKKHMNTHTPDSHTRTNHTRLQTHTHTHTHTHSHSHTLQCHPHRPSQTSCRLQTHTLTHSSRTNIQ